MQFYFHEQDQDILIIAVDGGLDQTTAQQFTSEVGSLIEEGAKNLLIDCSNLEYVSSYGMGVLLRLHRRMAKRSGDVKLAAVRGLVMQLIHVAHVDKMLDIYPDVDQARLAFRQT